MVREQTEAHRAVRRVLLWLAAGAVASGATGFVGLGFGMSEGVFFAFATIALALIGLALLMVEQATIDREKREEGEVSITHSGAMTADQALHLALHHSSERYMRGVSSRNAEQERFT